MFNKKLGRILTKFLSVLSGFILSLIALWGFWVVSKDNKQDNQISQIAPQNISCPTTEITATEKQETQEVEYFVGCGGLL